MTTKLEKMFCEMQESYRESFTSAFMERYNTPLETNFNIFNMALVSVRADGVDFTPEQHAFVTGYSEGYGKAVNIVLFRDSDDQHGRALREIARDAA